MLLDRRRDYLVPAPANAETLLDRFNRDFICMSADQPELLERAFQTRYQVYCVENPYENSAEHPDGLESDIDDDRSSHSILVSRTNGDAIGTVRLVLPLPGLWQSFSLRNIIDLSGGFSPTPALTTAEVSRFCLVKGSHRAAKEAPSQPRPVEPLQSLGLIQGLVRMSRVHGITHWCAVMEPRLLRMLSAMGIHFTPIGPLVEHHGFRQFCHCELSTVLKTMKRERPAFWDVVTDGGILV